MPTKQRIIFSSYDDIDNPYYGGGGAIAIHNVAKRLTKQFNVIVITNTYKGAKVRKKNGVLYKRIGFSFLGPQLGQLMFHFLLPWFVKRERFDLWIESFTPPFSTSCLQLFTNKPVIGLVHMLSGEDMQRKYHLPFPMIERFGLKTYKYFITVTKEVKQQIRKVNKSAEYFVIPVGIEEVIRNPSKNGKYILSLGRIEINQKGLDLLLKSYARISGRTKLDLIFAGNGLKKDILFLQKHILELGLLRRVRFLGKVSGMKKEALLAQAAAVVIPSRFDTFGLVALEAMAYEKPIIAFDIKGLKWIPDSCIVKVKRFDTALFGEKILEIITNEKKQKKLVEEEKRFVRKYRWEKLIGNYRQAFQSVL